ncbi:hypothetical protein ACVBEH_08265 [Roseateles sp. GG27B]
MSSADQQVLRPALTCGIRSRLSLLMMACLLGACASHVSLQEPVAASKRNALPQSWSEAPAGSKALTLAPKAIEPVRLTPLILLEDSLHPGASST